MEKNHRRKVELPEIIYVEAVSEGERHGTSAGPTSRPAAFCFPEGLT